MMACRCRLRDDTQVRTDIMITAVINICTDALSPIAQTMVSPAMFAMPAW